LDRGNDCVFCAVDWLRAFLRPREVKEITMNGESIVMLVVSALTMVYLIYALLRPEKF